jgi:hypothetical protein
MLSHFSGDYPMRNSRSLKLQGPCTARYPVSMTVSLDKFEAALVFLSSHFKNDATYTSKDKAHNGWFIVSTTLLFISKKVMLPIFFGSTNAKGLELSILIFSMEFPLSISILTTFCVFMETKALSL